MKSVLRLAMATVFVFALVLGFSQVHAQCPEDPDDRGNCDTLHVTCLDCEQTPGTGPWQVRFPLLITHDQTQPDDSIAGFVIPIGWTRTNPAKGCTLNPYWNTSSALWFYPDFSRSVFRHLLNLSDPTDTLMHNRMGHLGDDFMGGEWDTRILDLSTDDAYARMSIVATGTADQKWWEGDRILLATLTYVIEDTMTICMDTTFWPPTGNLLFSRGDAVTYTPRDNLPHCFTVGEPPQPDFTIEAAPDTQTVQPGQATDYTVTLTSVAGFDSPCTLTVTGLPGGAAASFAPNPVTPTNTSTMNVTTTGATPEGTYPLTVTATEIIPPLAPFSMGDHSATGPVQIQHSTQVVLKVIAAESITVTAPNGGEEWCVGSVQSITWTSSSIDTVKIEYSTDTGSNWITEVEKTPAAPGTYSWTVPNAPSPQCLVRICDARDGTPCDQSDAVFTIQAVPAAPSGCVASDDLCDKVQFSWTDNSGNEDGFIVYREGSALDTVEANVVSYDDLTAAPGVTYNYCVSAYNDCGESSQCCDDGTRRAPPTAPSDCVASDDLCDKVHFSWTDNSGDETGFYIYREGSKLDSVGADLTSFDDLTATPGVTYNYC
ncbi:MAG: fibronectin type III domain-containing protein, partial [Candidatus Zixiibacteriota bacterium]